MSSSPGHQTGVDAFPDGKSLVRQGVLSAQVLQFLETCLSARLNVAISGPPASGKRALLHALIPALVGDGQTLAVQNPDEPSLESSGITSLRAHLDPDDQGPTITRYYLLTLVPKMHPTGLVLDRVEGAEVVPLMELLLSMDGIMFSIDAASPQDALLELEELASVHGEAAAPTVARRILSTTLHLIIQLDRAPDGSSRLVSVTEVADAEEDCRALRDIFVCRDPQSSAEVEEGSDCTLRPTGLKPLFLGRIRALGIPLSEDTFG